MKIMPIIRRIFTSSSMPIRQTVASTAHASTPVFRQLSNVAESTVSVTTKATTGTNPIKDMMYKIFEEDGVSRSFVDRFIFGNETQKYYRYIGEDEFKSLLSGKNITSNRPCHRGSLTDVTSNPHYGKIPTIGKYRVTFKNKAEFDPFAQYKPSKPKDTKTRMDFHDIKDDEYYILGGYDLTDVEKIEKFHGSQDFETVYSSSSSAAQKALNKSILDSIDEIGAPIDTFTF